MSKLVDPHICPDCRAPLDTSATCTGCGLRLVGPAATELWERMNQADRLVEQLRTTVVPPSAATTTDPARTPVVPTAPPVTPGPRPARGLPGTSVPVVLLVLGGLCLLVAAIVFVAVAWGSLGLAAKTLIMLVVTALFGTGAVLVTRRGLRFAAEILWLVVAGLVTLDLAAAYGSNLLGLARIDDRHAVALIGATLLGLAVGVGAWATTTVLARLHGLILVGAAGISLFAGAEAWLSDHNPAAVAASVPLIVALAWGIDRVTEGLLRPTAGVVAGAGLVSWLVLVGLGLDRLDTTGTDRTWWSELVGWPLLVAAALAAAATAIPSTPRLPQWARMVAAGATLVTLALLAVGPSTGATADLLTWAAVSAALAGISAAAPLTWARPAAALTALSLVGWSLVSLTRPFAVISQLPTTAPTHDNNLGVHLASSPHDAAAWTAIASVLVVGATAAGLLRHVPWHGVRAAAGRSLIALGPGVLALGATTGLVETEPTLLAAVLAWSGTLALAGAMTVTVRHDQGALVTSSLFVAFLLVVGLRTAAASHLLIALLATGTALVLAVAYARAERRLLAGTLLPVLAAAATVLAGVAATHWPYLAGGRGDAVGVTLVGVSAVALLVARLVGRTEASRFALEGTALVVGLVATAFPTDHDTVATVLTVLGSAVAVVSVLNRDRDEAAWIGVALLGVATVIRVVDDVRAPETYTLPAGLLLLAAGWWRLGTDTRAGSVRALSSGLTLALVPSLLLALDEPVSLRGVLVAAGGVLALTIGAWRLWAAPFAAGAITTGVLALRHLGPVVDALPRWISLGSVGLVLLLVGVSWEQRRRDVAVAGRYLAGLR
jgi:hypothetical protein